MQIVTNKFNPIANIGHNLTEVDGNILINELTEQMSQTSGCCSINEASLFLIELEAVLATVV